jgi:hypothetical protein
VLKAAAIKAKSSYVNHHRNGSHSLVVNVYRKALPTNMSSEKESTGSHRKESQLRELKQWLHDQLITQEEYELEKQKVLATKI